MPPLNVQQTSNPYSANVLKVHDKDLLFTREFGTNTTADTGQGFFTSNGSSLPISSINARLGMQEVQTNANPIESPRGSVFFIPPFFNWPESPAVGAGVHIAVLYAHSLYKQTPDGSLQGAPSFADLVLTSSPPDASGLYSGPLLCCGLSGIGGLSEEPSDLSVDTFNNGGDFGPTQNDTALSWGREVYWRCIIVIDEKTEEPTISVAASEDGLAWQNIASTMLNAPVFFVGGGVRCAAKGLTDWIRLYSWVITDPSGIYLEPPPPETGGRLFTP